MNGKARMSLAMRGKKADRVPVMCQLALGHYFLNCKDKWKPHGLVYHGSFCRQCGGSVPEVSV